MRMRSFTPTEGSLSGKQAAGFYGLGSEDHDDDPCFSDFKAWPPSETLEFAVKLDDAITKLNMQNNDKSFPGRRFSSNTWSTMEIPALRRSFMAKKAIETFSNSSIFRNILRCICLRD